MLLINNMYVKQQIFVIFFCDLKLIFIWHTQASFTVVIQSE